MKAGRSLDTLIAEKVMGWEFSKTLVVLGKGTIYSELRTASIGERVYTNGIREDAFCPSTNMNHALKILDKTHHYKLDKSSPKQYGAYIYFESLDLRVGLGVRFANTQELAICLAALKAVGYE